jgi:hypothetical protein
VPYPDLGRKNYIRHRPTENEITKMCDGVWHEYGLEH